MSSESSWSCIFGRLFCGGVDVLVVGSDVVVIPDSVLIGSEYPPASQGVRFLVGVVFDPSAFFCCSAAFAFNNEVTSILTVNSVEFLPPSDIPSVLPFSHRPVECPGNIFVQSWVCSDVRRSYGDQPSESRLLNFQIPSTVVRSQKGMSRICRFNLLRSR